MTKQINPLYVFTLWYKPGKTMQGLIENGRGHRAALIAVSYTHLTLPTTD